MHVPKDNIINIDDPKSEHCKHYKEVVKYSLKELLFNVANYIMQHLIIDNYYFKIDPSHLAGIRLLLLFFIAH